MLNKTNSIVHLTIFFVFICLGIASIYYQINFDDLWLDEMNSLRFRSKFNVAGNFIET